MKVRLKVMDRLTTILAVEPLDDGAIEITFQDTTWRAERRDASHLDGLRSMVGLPLGAEASELVGKSFRSRLPLCN